MSNINPSNIDGTFPVAGQDNDSQGFRDNFTNMRNNLIFAKREIEDLVSKVVLKSALIGGTLDNNLAGASLSNANIKGFTEVVSDHQTVTGALVISFTDSPYHVFTTAGPVVISFTNAPTGGKVARFRVAMDIANVSHTVTLPATVTNTRHVLGATDAGSGAFLLTFKEVGKVVFEFTTSDSGSTYQINDITRGQILASPYRPSAVLTAAAPITSTALANVGLGFTALANTQYAVDALIPFSHNLATGADHAFSVTFPGTGVFMISHQASPTAGLSSQTITISDNPAIGATTSTAVKMAKISGVLTVGSTGGSVNIRAAASVGTVTIQPGAYVKYTQLT